ncbi:SusC/RagA family TonB-linked outer membrane protein [Luteibaculum oceani]|uniref:SusC/RagA family TonB-linked outer membrane protein n=1 Tax=Luteibaculum oceani TaxID=1294296 RepID=A0A5C6VBN5_9FLAO|nr:SusC/RagA family TonB-linked outer membrane protein [Luteibaculum oceani]TXC82081.1 SusC/RagA family TonB-linked outer membrane protein [Luteibaculum oceani]
MQKWYLLWCFALLTFGVNAQVAISGIVKDSELNYKIPGVTIVEKGISNGTTTNENGSYTLTVAKLPTTLIFTYVGYEPQAVEITEKKAYDISLEPDQVNLNEVVVTALGTKRSKKSLGYAVQELESKDITEVKAPNFLDNLSGKIAGVTVTQGATGVGSSSKISIRGEQSFTNNNPLFIVDGIPVNNNSIINYTNDAAAGFQEVDFGNGAMEINPDDIESVSVLKGPSAAALYGTRASNGVIVIETKDGSKSDGIGVSYSNSTFFERPFQLPKFQNTYGQGNSGQFEFVDGRFGVNDNISYSYGPRLDQGTLISQYDSPVTLPDGTVVRGGDVAVHKGAPITPTEFKSHPDNLKNFYETGVTTTNNVAISTSSKNGSARLSYTDLYSKSIIPGVNLKRKTISANLNFNPTERLKVGTAISYINSNSDNRPSSGYGSENVNYSLVAWGPRSLDIAPMKDYWQPGLENIQQYSFNYTFFDNPYFILLENRNAFNRDRVFGNVNASYKILDNLELQVSSGMDLSNELRTFRRAFSTNRFKNGGYAEHDVFYREVNSNIGLNYKRIFGDFTLDALVGANRMDQEATTNQIQSIELAQPGIFNFSNAAVPLDVFEFGARKRINSIYGIAKLGYKDYLFVDITGRNDWSSSLATITGTDNVSFFYPSISSSFILSNVIELPEQISFARLRASIAQVGNDTDPYQTQGVFLAQTPYKGETTFSDQNIIPNSNLLPEKTNSIELGGEVRFYNNLFYLDFTYFNATTENQIISLPVPVSSGYTQQVINGGRVNSTGWEIMAGVNAMRKGDFQWSSQINYSRYRNIVEELPNGVDQLTLAYSRVYDNVNQSVFFIVEKGGRIGDMYGTGYLKNENGDFVIDENGKYIVDNRLKKLGNANPDFIIGFNNQFKYKQFSLNLLMDWRHGGVLVSRTQALAGVAGQLEETENRPEGGIVAEGVQNTGTAENPVWTPNSTPVDAEDYYRQYYDRNHEENNTYNASYLKIRELSIGYTFRPEIIDGTFLHNFKNIRISLVGRNLFAFSEIPHFDPEQIAVQGNQFVSGVEDMSYASTRSIGFKIGFNF